MFNFNLINHFGHDDIFLLPISIILNNGEDFFGFYTDKKIDKNSLNNCETPFKLNLYEFRLLDNKIFLEDIGVDYGFKGSFLTYDDLKDETKDLIRLYKKDLEKYIFNETTNMYITEPLINKWYIEIKDIRSSPSFRNIKEVKQYGKNNY